MFKKYSFRDPVSNILKCWGFVDANLHGDLVREEPSDFVLEPGKWRLVNDTWEPYSAVVVPRAVTMRQARLALLDAGLLAQVSTAIDSLQSPDKEEARIEWEYSAMVERHRPLIAVLAPALGLTSEQVDQLFITAATL